MVRGIVRLAAPPLAVFFRLLVTTIVVVLGGDCVSGQSDAKGAETRESDRVEQLSRLAESFLGENGGNRFFYFPTKDQPYTPAKYGYKYEDVFFKSSDGTRLHGWFMPSTKGVELAKGTVVFSHGNTGSLAHHLGFVDWLMRSNYNVLLYDYRGFGRSDGKASRKGIIEDVQAAFSYIHTRKDVDASKIVSFAHSLGGAKSIVALALKPVKGVRAVIVHGTFASYRDMARQKAGELGAKLTSDELSAIDYVKKLAPVPMLFIHGENDNIVPFSQGLKLFEKAEGPKTLFRVPNGLHSNSLRLNRLEYRKKMLMWLDEKMG